MSWSERELVLLTKLADALTREAETHAGASGDDPAAEYQALRADIDAEIERRRPGASPDEARRVRKQLFEEMPGLLGEIRHFEKQIARRRP